MLRQLPDALIPGQPWSALAPMQDVTNLPFMQLLGKYGPPDLLFTEFFRVHGHSALDQPMIDSICKHDTGRPVFQQLANILAPVLEKCLAVGECETMHKRFKLRRQPRLHLSWRPLDGSSVASSAAAKRVLPPDSYRPRARVRSLG